MRSGRSWLVALTVCASLSAAAPARAAPPNSDPGAAEALFQRARALNEKGDTAKACPLFAESYRLDPAPGTLLNIAECSRSAGKSATAWSQFLEAARNFRRKDDERRAVFAEQQAQKLNAELAYVVIQVEKAAPELIVQRDGATISTASLDVKLPMDPGEHTIVAQAKGRLTSTLTFSARPRVTTTWLIPELKIAPAFLVKNDGGVAAHRPSAPAPGGLGPQRIAGFALGGVGLAALAVGGVFVGLTAMKASDLADLCPDQRCSTAEGSDALARAELFANVANGMLISGGLVAAAGLVVFLTAPSTDPDAMVWQLSPRPGGAALHATF